MNKRLKVLLVVLAGGISVAFIGLVALVVVFLVTFDGEKFGQGMIIASNPEAFGNPTPVAVSITTSIPPVGEVEAFYELTLQVNGGPAYRWTVVSGNLPYGLSLNSSTGVISGVPVKAGFFNFEVQVQGFSTSDADLFRITVLPEGGGRSEDRR